MWNENSALELLKSMPEKLSQEDLALLQGVLDADKYVISAANGRDMCGEFAPFCKICNKEGSTPCATAYVNMKRGEGLNYKFASECDDETIEEENGQSLEHTDAVASSAAADGVGALKSATKSAIVKSVSCPTAEIIGISE